MLQRSPFARLILTLVATATVIAGLGLLPGAKTAEAKDHAPGSSALVRIQPSRAISIPYGISSATLLGNSILVRGHAGSGPVIVDGTHAVEAGCPPGGHTVDLSVKVRDRSVSATLAIGNDTASCTDSTWEVSTDVHTPGAFEAGNEVWVCAHALVRTDPSAEPGHKGRVVGFRHWCKTVELE